MIPEDIRQRVIEELQTEILTVRPLGGGCIHQAHRMETPERTYFIKWNRPDQWDNFRVEQKGLESLDETNTVRIPEVVMLGKTNQHAFLMLEFVESGRPAKDYWTVFGANIARLHQHSHDQFGLSYDNYIGSLPQPNGWKDSWVEFFIERRIRPKLRQALDQGSLSRDALRKFETLFGKLADFFPDEPPALLHGDLWGGNILVGEDGHAVIFDPAVYYGHREMELAFMTLFERQPRDFYNAYQEVWSLEAGWEDRLDLYNFYPLLVHVILFGRGYVDSLMRVLGRYV